MCSKQFVQSWICQHFVASKRDLDTFSKKISSKIFFSIVEFCFQNLSSFIILFDASKYEPLKNKIRKIKRNSKPENSLVPFHFNHCWCLVSSIITVVLGIIMVYIYYAWSLMSISYIKSDDIPDFLWGKLIIPIKRMIL